VDELFHCSLQGTPARMQPAPLCGLVAVPGVLRHVIRATLGPKLACCRALSLSHDLRRFAPPPVTGAQSRRHPPRDGCCQDDTRPNDHRNPKPGVSAQRRQCQHHNKACAEQNAVRHRINQCGNLHACPGFPCHRRPLRLPLSNADSTRLPLGRRATERTAGFSMSWMKFNALEIKSFRSPQTRIETW
jgi:hypothetical protein